jgi:hypothetical protein
MPAAGSLTPQIEARFHAEPWRGNFVDIADKFAVNEMAFDNDRAYGKELVIAFALFAAGLAISCISVIQLTADQPQEMAQATQPLQPSPSEPPARPAESKPGGERPTTPAPEPARPVPDAQKTGAQPALPPAPAEKVAPPIKEK